MNSATSSAPRVFGPTGFRSTVAQTFWRRADLGSDRQIVAEHSRMIDRPDSAQRSQRAEGSPTGFPGH